MRVRPAVVSCAAAVGLVFTPVATAAPVRVAAAPTAMRHVSPVDSSGVLADGYHVGRHYGDARCQRGSAMTGSAYRCFTSRSPAGVYDPCWVTADAAQVLCLVRPWVRRAVQLHVTGGYDDTDGFGKQPRPWAARLSTGERCLLHPAAVESTHGQAIHYYCRHHVALAGAIDRRHPTWRVHAYRNTTPHGVTATYEALGRVAVATVWRGKPSRGDRG